MPWTSEHIKWLVDTGERLKTNDGKEVKVWESRHEKDDDIALGNILGSNLFNTLAVVGIAGAIHPMAVGPEVFNHDIMVMAALTLSLFVIGYAFRGPGRINRIEAAVRFTKNQAPRAVLLRSIRKRICTVATVAALEAML